MDTGWNAIFDKYAIEKHDFDAAPYPITAQRIKEATSHLRSTSEKEVRLLCKQDTREQRPKVFRDRGLFLLPTTNGGYSIFQGEGYVEVPPVTTVPTTYVSKMDFLLESSLIGSSKIRHLDFAYASSLIRNFMQDDSLVLTIRGRKYTPRFDFRVGKHSVTVSSVQTEVDAGYEGRKQIVLVEAKNFNASNVIIRQLYYPFRQWTEVTTKPVVTLFFAKSGHEYQLWKYEFTEPNDYNSIQLTGSRRFVIEQNIE